MYFSKFLLKYIRNTLKLMAGLVKVNKPNFGTWTDLPNLNCLAKYIPEHFNKIFVKNIFCKITMNNKYIK